MKKLAVVAGGWHFPLHFYRQLAAQKIPEGWEVDLFCVSHRDPKFSAEEKQEFLSHLGSSYAEKLDKVLYEKIATVSELQALGWTYLLCPNTNGDWEITNQWLEKYDYKHYDVILATHDDNFILNDRLYTDLLVPDSDWLILTNSTGSFENWSRYFKTKFLGHAINLRASFEFIKTELLDMLGGRFDLSATTLTREGEVFSPQSQKAMKAINNWNMNVIPMKEFLRAHKLARRVQPLSDTYRVSDYCIEGERGFISSIQPANKKEVERGLGRIEKLYDGKIFTP